MSFAAIETFVLPYGPPFTGFLLTLIALSVATTAVVHTRINRWIRAGVVAVLVLVATYVLMLLASIPILGLMADYGQTVHQLAENTSSQLQDGNTALLEVEFRGLEDSLADGFEQKHNALQHLHDTAARLEGTGRDEQFAAPRGEP